MSKDLKRLIEVARGLYPPALVLKNGKVVNTFSCEVEPLDVAIHDGMVVGVGHYDGPNVVDVAGDYLIPGFID
ncbi:MAG: adenine deaminase, partial [bacterium]